MSSLRPLNGKERKRILEQLERQFGCDAASLKRFVFLLHEKKGKVYVANEALFDLDLERLRVDRIGLYLGSLLNNGELRLSVEGSQMVGPASTTNVLSLSDGEFSAWIRGGAIPTATELRGFVIVRHGVDFCGCGKPVLDEKDGSWSLHNYVPKTRYVRSEE